ncbi:MAG: flavodoxin [Clostridiales Family XIII bacterium]|jgi:flavodoxin short chain|nr:flavodoxin [Clostridiales Family XIII bacterium]
MSKMVIVYWTQTGNTKKMADLIAEGARDAGAEADVFDVSGIAADRTAEYERIALGCPSMGAEVLEEDAFQPFYDELSEKLAGKKVALFGSYGWGDGEWMRNWRDAAKESGANLFGDEGLIVNYEPAGDDIARCKDFGNGFARY